MQFNNNDPLESFSSREETKVEAEDFLEEKWFFGNLLGYKPKMTRSYSDPSPSSTYGPEMFVMGRSTTRGSSSVKKVSRSAKVDRNLIGTPLTLSGKIRGESHVGKHDVFRARRSVITQSPHENLVRAPSLPEEEEESEFSMGKLIRQASFNSSETFPPLSNLRRAPCLAPCVWKEEDEEEESDFCLGKLIRQASLMSAGVLPPRHKTKNVAYNYSSSISRHQLPGEKPGGINKEGWKGERSQFLANLTQAKKSLNDVEEKCRMDLKQDKARRRPYHSQVKSSISNSSIPERGIKKSPEHMKAQIKFWARAVASNIRQEC